MAVKQGNILSKIGIGISRVVQMLEIVDISRNNQIGLCLRDVTLDVGATVIYKS